MPISEYYGGHGSEVMSNMAKQYGAKKGKQVFYATANKRKSAPKGSSVGHRMAKMVKKG